MMWRFAIVLLLAGCGEVVVGPSPDPQRDAPEVARSARAAEASFRRAAGRIEPVAEQVCRTRNPDFGVRGCDYRFQMSTDPRLGQNAFQTIGEDGRPQVVFTLSLLQVMRNDDEVAFVLAHEAAHQVRRHVLRASAQQRLGATLLGTLAAASGTASDESVRAAAGFGAFLGRRAYSKQFEFEADALAVRIARAAGYDPIRGAAPFARFETGSNAFLATHPPSADRLARIEAVAGR
ncbi:M48 family metalloprotease [Algicella marina]|uniref:M48 family metalloprotease n=1 Tax=Algicella marina TaxID=2683284 RepID=A0A6P1T2D8_9RHOB|nr:M48 family metalloprotease [Algicella marina]QHQ35479.1 M48 family metalloprotease [Algicella marina]